MDTMTLSIADLPSLFADIAPIPQNDDGLICRIDYKDDFVTAHNYFRGIVAVREHSSRALQLTQLCLQLNPANYTVWQYRRACLVAISSSSSSPSTTTTTDYYEAEFALAAKLGGDNPKNYQIWYHRRALLQHNARPDRLRNELEYIATVLAVDGKNYHAWSQRQWVVPLLDNWDDELEFVSKLVHEDPRNNSAWNHRWFVTHHHSGGTIDLETVRREADYAIEMARVDPYNECPWRYLIATVRGQRDNAMMLIQEYLDKTWTVQDELLLRDRRHEESYNLLSAAVDLLELQATKAAFTQVIELTQKLAFEVDTIRCKYWMMRCEQAQAKMAQISEH